jgi:hypothetical protein
MNPMRLYLLALAVLSVAVAASCTKPAVSIKVTPEQLSAPGQVQVQWKTKDFTTTTISSNPTVSGLPKTVTGNANATDLFNVNSTTTFEIKGQTAGQNGPFVKVASATVGVTGIILRTAEGSP